MRAIIKGQELELKAIHFVNEVVRKGDIQTKPNGDKSYAITLQGQTIEFDGGDPAQASVRYIRGRGFYTE